MIEFQPSADQTQIVDSVAGYLQREFPLERLQPKAAARTVRAAWSELAEQGFFALAASEDIGGAGFTVVEEMLAHREFGRALASPSVLATGLAIHLLEGAGLKELAAGLVRGEQHVAMGLARGPLSLGPVVDGPLHLVDSEPADLILLQSADGLALFERNNLVDVEPVASLDESVTLHRARAVGVAASVSAADSSLPQRSALLLAASLVGMAEAARDQAVDHARIREQFGKHIGSFQGVAHHCADMEVRTRAARAQTSFAAIALHDARADAAFHVSAAAIVAADAGIRNATMAIRVLGGLGFTAECALHLYLKRSHLYERMAGGSRALEADILRHRTEAIFAGV